MNTIFYFLILQIVFVSLAYGAQVKFDTSLLKNLDKGGQAGNSCPDLANQSVQQIKKNPAQMKKLSKLFAQPEYKGEIEITPIYSRFHQIDKDGRDQVIDSFKIRIINSEDKTHVGTFINVPVVLQRSSLVSLILGDDPGGAKTIRNYYAPETYKCRDIMKILEDAGNARQEGKQAQLTPEESRLQNSLNMLAAFSGRGGSPSASAIFQLSSGQSSGQSSTQSGVDRNDATAASAEVSRDYAKIAADAFVKARDFLFPEDGGRSRTATGAGTGAGVSARGER